MRLIGKNGEIKIGGLVGESPIGKVVSITDPNKQYPEGMLMIEWAGPDPAQPTLPAQIGAKFQENQ
jgi:hypothetical protein